MDPKIKHLEMILTIINRMSNNSFLLKGWTVTLVSAMLALFVKNQSNFTFSLFPVIMFWLLDAFFLRQERLYRTLYKRVSKTDNNDIDFSMNTCEFVALNDSWIKVFFSRTLLVFYGAIVGTIFLVCWLQGYRVLWGLC